MPTDVVICDAKTPSDDSLEADVLGEYGIPARYASAITPEDAIAVIDDANGVIVDSLVPITAQVLESCPNLDVVARAGIGVDNVDLDAAERLGITVLHHPTYSIDEVAAHALSLALSGVRLVPLLERDASEGSDTVGDTASIPRLSSLTFGILGFGKIGRRFARLVEGIGTQILATDPYVDDNIIRTANVSPVEFDELLERADVLSVHAPLTPETRGLIDQDAIEALEDEAILVNTARGPIVDTDAVEAALLDGRLGFAGLDVTDPEPLPPEHPLYEMDRAIITPHMAWYSEASRSQLRQEVAADVGRFLTGEPPEHEVQRDEPWM